MLGALAAGAGVGIVSGLMQWQNSKEARAASAAERARIGDLIEKLKDPEFDTRLILPEEYEVVEKYVPQVAEYVAEVAPEVVKAASEGAVRGRQAQMETLDRLRNMSQSGDDVISRIATDEALESAAEPGSGQRELIQQQMARRGMGGSGMELVAQLTNQQNSNESAQEGAQKAAADAQLRRLQTMRDSAALGGDIRNQDVNMEAKNADIVNSYNTRQAQDRQAYLNNVANTMNDASVRNIGAKQTAADKNVQGRNTAITNQRDLVNNQKSATYNHQMNKANLQIGQAAKNIDAIQQEAADKNAAISGIANVAGSGISAYQQDELNEKKGRAQYGDKWK